MARFKKILQIAALIVVVPVCIVIFLPVACFLDLQSRIALFWFLRQEAGRYYLVCTAKNDWRDFLNNNVIPVLPKDIMTVWLEHERSHRGPPLIDHLARSGIFGVSKPFLVAVLKKGLTVRSLNQELLSLKKSAKINEETRLACREVILSAQRALVPSGSK